MTTAVLLLRLIAMVLIGLAPSMPAAQADVVYTADEWSSTVTVIDVETGIAKKLSLSISPRNLDITPDRKTLLVTGLTRESQTKSGAMGVLALIDLSTPSPKMLATVGVGTDAAHVVSDGRIGYVTVAGENEIVAVDLAGRSVKYRIAVGRSPSGLRFSPDGRMIAVANTGDGSVSLVRPAIGIESRRIFVGWRPFQVAFAPQGNTLLVSLNGEEKLALVDVRVARTIDKIKVGRGPTQVSITADGKMAVVANRGSGAKPDDRVSLVDLQTASTTYVRSGAGAHGVAIRNEMAYVTNMYEDTLSALHIKRREIIQVFKTGKSPRGVAVR